MRALRVTSNLMFVILLLSLLNIGVLSSTPSKSSPKSRFQFRRQLPWSEFIGNVISQHFRLCSLVVVRTSSISSKSHKLQRSPFDGSYFHSTDLESVSTIPSLQLTLSTANILQGSRLFQKFALSCKLVVTHINNAIKEPDFSNSFFDMLTPSNNELTKRDEDNYIFVTKTFNDARSLLFSKIFTLLKYRIVIHQNEKSFFVHTFCQYCPGSSILSTSSYAYGSVSSIFPDFTRNYHHGSIRTSGPTKYTAIYEMKMENGKYVNKRGVFAQIIDEFTQKFNMSYTVEPCLKLGPVPEGSTGVLLENGTWAGCVGDVSRSITDLAVLVSADMKRYEVVAFSSAIDYSYVIFTTSKPELFHSWRVIFWSFDRVTWIAVTISVILTTMTVYKVDQGNNDERGRSFSYMRFSLIERMSRTGLHLFGYLVGQDIPPPKAKPSSRMAYICWLYYGLIIGAAYGSALQALIVSPNKEFVPRRFSELVNLRGYKWGAAKGFRNGLGEQLFKHSENPVMRNLYHRMDALKDPISCQGKELDSKYACFDWEVTQRFVTQMMYKDKSGYVPFQSSTEAAFFVPMTLITRKRELFRSGMNSYIAKCFDTGLTKAMWAIDWRNYRIQLLKKTKGNSATKSKVELKAKKTRVLSDSGLDTVKGEFYILLIGLVGGVVCFLVEKMVERAKL